MILAWSSLIKTRATKENLNNRPSSLCTFVVVWRLHRWLHVSCFVYFEPIFGKGMRRSTFQWKKGFSVKRGEAIQWMRGLVRLSTGKAIQWRGPGHSVNRRTLKIEKLLSSSPSRKWALIYFPSRVPVLLVSPFLALPFGDWGSVHQVRTKKWKLKQCLRTGQYKRCASRKKNTNQHFLYFHRHVKTEGKNLENTQRWGFHAVLCPQCQSVSHIWSPLAPQTQSPILTKTHKRLI